MPAPPERGNLSFDPPLKMRSDEYNRAWELLLEMDLSREVVFRYVGMGAIKGLSFPTREQAMMFRLRL